VKVSTVLFVLPVVIIAAIIAVANRQPVTFSLDPFSANFPAVAFTLPLYLLVFLSILFGVLLGGATVALRRTRRRRVPDLAPVADDALAAREPVARREPAE
jgi:uncharacterized integral membrane protein